MKDHKKPSRKQNYRKNQKKSEKTCDIKTLKLQQDKKTHL